METENPKDLNREELSRVKQCADDITNIFSKLNENTIGVTDSERERFKNNFGEITSALEAYQETSGHFRKLFIDGIKYVLENSEVPLEIKADIMFTFVNSSINLTQVHDSIVQLAATPDLNYEPLNMQLQIYFTKMQFRETQASG